MRTRWLSMAACAVAFTGIAAAQTKVAVVNMQQAILETAEIKKASADLEAKYKPEQAAIEKLRTELTEIQQKLQAGEGKLTQQAAGELTVRAQRTQRDLQRKGQDVQEQVDAERSEILRRTGQRMTAVVGKLAEARGFDVVVEAQGVIFAKPAADLTKDAVAEFDKAYPPK
jgi:outer membrane protein